MPEGRGLTIPFLLAKCPLYGKIKKEKEQKNAYLNKAHADEIEEIKVPFPDINKPF